MARSDLSVEGHRVGLFGLLGSGNIGNDASMEAVLRYLGDRHPSVVVDVMCSGPETVTERYGLGAVQMFCFDRREARGSGPVTSIIRLLSRVLDIFRISAWVRRHDIVIVPGAGVLEASLLLRPWNTPYGLLILSLSGRIFGTKVALVSVGAGPINKRASRWFCNWAARLASYRSFRDDASREAMRQRGLRGGDPVFPDLAFYLPRPEGNTPGAGDWSVIGVGIMAYDGSNDDRDRAEDIYRSYVGSMKSLVRWLLAHGRRVRLFIGDTNGPDDRTAQEILADARLLCPDGDEAFVVVESVTTFREVMEAMEPLGAVIATRFHNLMASLMLSKPTIAVGYASKHQSLMSSMGVDECSHAVQSLDIDELTRQLLELERDSAHVVEILSQRNRDMVALLEIQFDDLDGVLFGENMLPSQARTASVPGLVSHETR